MLKNVWVSNSCFPILYPRRNHKNTSCPQEPLSTKMFTGLKKLIAGSSVCVCRYVCVCVCVCGYVCVFVCVFVCVCMWLLLFQETKQFPVFLFNCFKYQTIKSRRLLQYCQFLDKNSCDILRDISNFKRYFNIFFIAPTISRGTRKDVLRSPGWKTLVLVVPIIIIWRYCACTYLDRLKEYHKNPYSLSRMDCEYLYFYLNISCLLKQP
jgi:hypothetical protein